MLREGNLLFFRNCTNAIRTLASLKWKAPRIIKGVEIIDEDEAQGQEDHLPDVIRYFCMERCSPRQSEVSDDELWEINKRLRNPILSIVEREKLEDIIEKEESYQEFDESEFDENW
jgi:hypothetical protein